MTDLQQKPTGLFRIIITKLFCHHRYVEIYKVESHDRNSFVTSISAARECTICGKTKKVSI